MPRPKKDSITEPKRRSRAGCWPCKARKVKCGEEKPQCQNCTKQGEPCDYSIRLNWEGRPKRPSQDAAFAIGPSGSGSPNASGSVTAYDVQSSTASTLTPTMTTFGLQEFPPSLRSGPSAALYSPSSTEGSFMPPNRQQGIIQPLLPWGPDVVLPDSRRPSLITRTDYASRSESGSKRIKLSPEFSEQNAFARPLLPLPSPRTSINDRSSTASTLPSAYSVSNLINAPPTSDPNEAGIRTENLVFQPRLSVSTDAGDFRRLSVSSLLSGPPGDTEKTEQEMGQYPRDTPDGSILYGYDYGLPDLDTPRSDDRSAVMPRSPASLGAQRLPITSLSSSAGSTPDPSSLTLGTKDIALERGGYYAAPVQIKISKTLGPLPPSLMENPMNLLYFHHFMNHTARILVPHDCPHNPLRTVVPRLACSNTHLMNLLLAYSATHRARLLNAPEPVHRIAMWVRDVFPVLRAALSSPEPASDSAIATSIMLASLEIISPNTFDVPVTWQNHLAIARRFVRSRGGIRGLSQSNQLYLTFLAKWFAYLEIIGSLSGANTLDDSFSGEDFSFGDASDQHTLQIDCFLGFTTQCISLLARVARLSRDCDARRPQGPIDCIIPLPARTTAEADHLRVLLEDSRKHVLKGCTYSNPAESTEDKSAQDIQEIYSCNEMFHWAGMIHLDRRVLGKASTHPDVQFCVKSIVAALRKVRRGSCTEGGVLFPMFTAGCDAVEESDREIILRRLRGVEQWGMVHVKGARMLMQRVWETGRPWETLVGGEFFG